MITRRSILLGALSAALPFPLRAQPERIRIGILTPGRETTVIPNILEALAQRGYRDAVEAEILLRSADDVAERFPPLARELIDAKCRLIFAIGNDLPVRALRAARSDIPIVFTAITYDPLEKGVVRSLGRPDGNATGVYIPTSTAVVKRFELAREILPRAKGFLVLSDMFTRDQLAAVRMTANALGAELTVVEYRSAPYDHARAFEAGRKAEVEAVFVLTSRRLALDYRQVVALAEKYRLPAFGAGIAAPWLASYTIDGKVYASLAADIAVRILNGAKPADIPVVQPDVYEIVVNLRRARELGIEIPPSVLVRATRVIQ